MEPPPFGPVELVEPVVVKAVTRVTLQCRAVPPLGLYSRFPLATPLTTRALKPKFAVVPPAGTTPPPVALPFCGGGGGGGGGQLSLCVPRSQALSVARLNWFVQSAHFGAKV